MLARTSKPALFVVSLLGVLLGCSSSGKVDPVVDTGGVEIDSAPVVVDSTVDSTSPSDGSDATAESAIDASTDISADTNKAAGCVATFGSALPAGFIRIDGTVVAVIAPGTESCAMPNRDHLIVEVMMGGAVYRMVVNVKSTVAGVDPDVFLADHSAALPSPAWADGVHAGVSFDYVTTLSMHSASTEFVKHSMADVVSLVTADIDVGAKISFYASGDGGDSVHLVHRNLVNEDGAIVLDPTGPSPRFLLFHFANQSF